MGYEMIGSEGMGMDAPDCDPNPVPNPGIQEKGFPRSGRTRERTETVKEWTRYMAKINPRKQLHSFTLML